MQKRWIVFLVCVLLIIGIYAVGKVYYERGEGLNKADFAWYESQICQEIEEGNKFAQERLAQKYPVFLMEYLWILVMNGTVLSMFRFE